MEPAEIALVRDSMHHLVTTCTPDALATALVDSGWGDLLAADAEVAISTLAGELGRSVAAGPMLDVVLLHGLGLGLDTTVGVLLPALARGAAASFAGSAAGDEVLIDGLAMAGADRAERFLVATPDGVMAVPTTALTVRATGAGDPTLGLSAVAGRAARATIVAPPERWIAALAIARRALAAELIGLSERMLEETITYVRQREQFGRAIGSFQSVKHRLADVRVAIVAAGAGLSAAWSDGSEISAIAALCLAARAEQLAATHCHQVHGGIAFTVEHGFHRFLRRGQVLIGLLGHPDDLVQQIGAHLVESGAVPRTPRLG